MKNNSPLLIAESPLQVLPSLAIMVGLNESMILQQIHYWLNNKDKRAVPYIRENLSWVYNTHKDWHEQFPFWSVSTIRRAIQNLEDQGMLITRQFDLQEGDNKKYYTINYANLNARIASPPVQIEHTPPVQIEQTPPVQIEHTHLSKLNTPPVQNEHLYNKEAETTTETTTERERKGKLSPPPVIEDFDEHMEEMENVISFLKQSYHLTGYIKPYQERDLAQLSFQIIQNKIALSDLKQFFTTARKIPPMNFLVSDYFLAQENASRAAKASPATQNTNIVARLKEQMPDDIKQASEATQVKWIANHYAEAKQQMAATTA